MHDDPNLKDEKTFVLIVEDNTAQTVFLQAILEDEDYEVARAVNGPEALNLLELRRPAIIISDVTMPGMDGYELCRLIKSMPKFRPVPFMLLTALANPQDIFKGLESGADYYCLKPYKVPVLLGRLRSILADASTQYAPSAQPGTDVTYGGQKYSIHAGRNQILGLLLATFETIAQKNKELAETNQKLTEALDTNFTLRSLIPICGHCKKIRDDQGYWDQVENFVTRHYDARFTHDICPQCAAKTKAAWQQPKQNPPKT